MNKLFAVNKLDEMQDSINELEEIFIEGFETGYEDDKIVAQYADAVCNLINIKNNAEAMLSEITTNYRVHFEN